MITVIKEYCPQNHPCPTVSVCPTGAITQKGYAAPQVDNDACIDCCRCTKSCNAFRGTGKCA